MCIPLLRTCTCKYNSTHLHDFPFVTSLNTKSIWWGNQLELHTSSGIWSLDSLIFYAAWPWIDVALCFGSLEILSC